MRTINPSIVEKDRKAFLSELFFKSITALFFARFVHIFLNHLISSFNIFSFLLFFKSSFDVAFSVFRRNSKAGYSHWYSWLIALVRTVGPLCFKPAPFLWMPLAGATLLFTGISLELASLLSLGRSFGIVATNRGVKTGGAYHFIRHPLYFSYLVSNLGYTLANFSFANFMVCLCSFAAIILSIVEEERVLVRDLQFLDYKKEVPWRLFPGVF